MLISIITTTFNSEEFLEAALASYKIQDHLEKELIIIDGASSDKTLAIIDQHKDLYHFFISEKDRGIYDALNKGISNASGEVIGILHSDDLYYNGKVLTEVNRMFESQPALQAVYGDLQYVKRDDPAKVIRNWVSGKWNIKKLSFGWMPPHPALFIRKQCFEEFGNYQLKYHSAADYDLILRFLYKHQIKTAYLPGVLMKMRVGGLSNQSLKNRWRANSEDREAMKENGISYPALVAFLKPLRKIKQFLK
jgi:glycosyltransferase